MILKEYLLLILLYKINNLNNSNNDNKIHKNKSLKKSSSNKDLLAIIHLIQSEKK